MLHDTLVESAPEVKSTEKVAYYGYIYLTTITTPRNTLYYVGQHQRPEFNPTYNGSGRVVGRAREKYGHAALSTVLIARADTKAELDALEVAYIVWSRAEHGKFNVNLADGGEGFTPKASRRLWASASYRSRHSAAMKEAMSRPDIKARRSVAMKEVQNRPEVKARHSVAAKAAYKRPEVKARMLAALREAMSRPEVRTRISDAAKERQNRPEVKAIRSEIMKEAMSRPEVKAYISKATKKAMSRPDVKARHVAAMNRPETKARHAASVKEAHNRPEVKARKSAVATEAMIAFYATTAPLKAEWKAIAHLYPGVEPPHGACGPTKWRAFVEDLKSKAATVT
jgi:hypothetical protein